MGLLQQAYRTYCAMEPQHMGRYDAKLREPLAPVSHIITAAQLEITLNADGTFRSAAAVDKEKIIIPATEESAGRTSAPAPHPLCDQLCYLANYDEKKHSLYVNQLRDWADSPYGHPTVTAVLAYVQGNTILEDLQKFDLIRRNDKGIPEKEKLLVRWRILSEDGKGVEECWKDRSLFSAFTEYYRTKQSPDTRLCMISGLGAVPAKQHPKGIISLNGNAKLISANDDSGFTYRGRFSEDWQAASIGYEVSQKVHNALRWLAANQGVTMGGRTFLCWNPEGIALTRPTNPMLKSSAPAKIKPSDYQAELKNTLNGLQSQLPADAKAVIAAFDAATTGRLSVTYFNELQASDFLERLYRWDLHCCWPRGKFGIQSPSLLQIIHSAFGTQRTEKQQLRLVADDKIVGPQMQRLIACRVDCANIPVDIVNALKNRASARSHLDPSLQEGLLFTACAVIRYYHDKKEEEYQMALEPNKKDISYQYGRLLAVLEKIERDTYSEEETREPNAMRLQTVFAQRPQAASRIIWEQVKKAYLPRLKPAIRTYYERILTEIVEKISEFSDVEQTRPLGDTYLLGYYLQRSDLYTSKKEKTETEE